MQRRSCVRAGTDSTSKAEVVSACNTVSSDRFIFMAPGISNLNKRFTNYFVWILYLTFYTR